VKWIPPFLNIKQRKNAESLMYQAQDTLEKTIKKRTSELTLTNQKMLDKITERKQAEEALRESEKKFRNLFNNAPIMYAITENRDGVPIIKDINKKFLSVLGYSREEVVGNSLAKYYTPESAYELLEGGGYQRALFGSFTEEERSFLTRNGQIIETLIQAVPEMNKSGKSIGTRSTFLDVTDRKKAESEKNQLQEQLAQTQKMDAMGTLAGGIAHEFNNILGVIIGNTELEIDWPGN
jgi:PAS domain S-box-containing protein